MKVIFVLLTLISAHVYGQFNGTIFNDIKSKNFFAAKQTYNQTKKNYTKAEQEFIEATLENAFNKPEISNERINLLLSDKSVLPDSVSLRLYQLKTDNLIKLYEYKKASETIAYMLKTYKAIISEEKLADWQNSYKLWDALKDAPKQTIDVAGTTKQKMKIDKAGLKNLSVSNGNGHIDFIFDTGANLSTVNQTTAEKLQMTIIPADIEVGSITGQKVNTNLAICPLLKIGDIEIKNAVFLVMKDDALYIPQIDYKMNGIIGFPIINALREIQLTKDGYFIIPEKETKIAHFSNMALDELTPMIFMNDMHFSFDSGASESILYQAFYLKYKNEIDGKYPLVEFGFGGAAGSKKFSGFSISHRFDILDKKVDLENLKVIKDKIKNEETVYGNIGQDIINQFDKMTLNFDQMFIKFD